MLANVKVNRAAQEAARDDQWAEHEAARDDQWKPATPQTAELSADNPGKAEETL